jgi:hypothetical protein
MEDSMRRLRVLSDTTIIALLILTTLVVDVVVVAVFAK